jgi:hypothetical protein
MQVTEGYGYLKTVLDNEFNLILLDELVSGEAVSVNLSELSRELDKHRQTILSRVEEIFLYGILDEPAYPFLGLYKERPLLVTVQLEMPDDERFVNWIKEDPCIFAAFHCRHCEYNTILFIYHKDVTEHLLWREALPTIMVDEYGISEDLTKFMSTTSYYSNQLMMKYNPGEGVHLLEKQYKDDGRLIINGYKLDDLDMDIVKLLATGMGIKTDLTNLCERTGKHRRTVSKRISMLIEEGYLAEPVCRFPTLFVPPGSLFTLSLIEIRNHRDRIIDEMVKDFHVPLVLKTISGQYNLLLFSNHKNISEYLQWEEGYRERYSGCFGSTDITYLTPQMRIPFDYKIVSLSIIRNKLKESQGRKLRDTLRVK